MKIDCRCGATIYDSADELPGKGHLIPDQEWFGVHELIESEVIDALAAGRLSAEGACMKMRQIFTAHARLLWQCGTCGRLYIDGPDGGLQAYAPGDDRADKQVLRGRVRDE